MPKVSGSARFWNLCYESYYSICIAVRNMSMMPDNNRFGGRQPNAIPTSRSGARGIYPVETIKVTRKLSCVNPFTWIGYRDTKMYVVKGESEISPNTT